MKREVDKVLKAMKVEKREQRTPIGTDLYLPNSTFDKIQARTITIRDNLSLTNPLYLSNGTVALPSLTFDGDRNTGFFWVSADIFAVTCGGVEQARWNINSTTMSCAGRLIVTTTLFIGNGQAIQNSADATAFNFLTNSGLEVAPVAKASGVPLTFRITSPAHTGTTASTEVINFNVNTSATRQWATGALTTQRETVFQAPTYAFVGASTLTTAATVAITGAPIQGSAATIVNSYAFWAQGGVTRLDGNLSMGNDALILRDVDTSLTASTTQTQGGALGLTAEINVVTTVTNANDTVRLPPAAAGMYIIIQNAAAANTLQIFPASGDAINAAAVDASKTLAIGSIAHFFARDATTWTMVNIALTL